MLPPKKDPKVGFLEGWLRHHFAGSSRPTEPRKVSALEGWVRRRVGAKPPRRFTYLTRWFIFQGMLLACLVGACRIEVNEVRLLAALAITMWPVYWGTVWVFHVLYVHNYVQTVYWVGLFPRRLIRTPYFGVHRYRYYFDDLVFWAYHVFLLWWLLRPEVVDGHVVLTGKGLWKIALWWIVHLGPWA